jgi:phage tail-like protein
MAAPSGNFNFRVLFSAAAAESTSLESGDALAAAGAQAAQIVPVGPLAPIQAGFAEVTGIDSEIEIEEYREGGRNIGPRRFPRWGRFPNLVLRRGITSNTALWDWWADVITHSYTLQTTRAPLRRNGVILLDGFDHKPVAAWFFSNALPERLTGPGLYASRNEIAIETLELSHEGLLRLSAVPPGA